MAGLHKPKSCPCGSADLHREWQPERWVCDLCNNVVITRSAKPITGICTKCGAKKEDGVEFVPRHNCCRACKRKYNREYTDKNYDKLREQHRTSYQRDKSKRTASIRVSNQRSPEAFLTSLVRQVRTRINKNYKGRRRIENFDIDAAYIIDMWKSQQGCCALSGLPMVHKYGNLNTVSIDRIDSSKDYIRSNVQLVCKFVNLGKSNHSNAEVIKFFDDYAIRISDDVLD